VLTDIDLDRFEVAWRPRLVRLFLFAGLVILVAGSVGVRDWYEESECEACWASLASSSERWLANVFWDWRIFFTWLVVLPLAPM